MPSTKDMIIKGDYSSSKATIGYYFMNMKLASADDVYRSDNFCSVNGKWTGS